MSYCRVTRKGHVMLWIAKNKSTYCFMLIIADKGLRGESAHFNSLFFTAKAVDLNGSKMDPVDPKMLIVHFG